MFASICTGIRVLLVSIFGSVGVISLIFALVWIDRLASEASSYEEARGLIGSGFIANQLLLSATGFLGAIFFSGVRIKAD